MAAQRLVRRIPVGDSVVDAILALGRRRPARPRRDRAAALCRLGPGAARQPGADAGLPRPALIGRALRALVEDVLALAPPVLRHRMAVSFAAAPRGSPSSR